MLRGPTSFTILSVVWTSWFGKISTIFTNTQISSQDHAAWKTSTWSSTVSHFSITLQTTQRWSKQSIRNSAWEEITKVFLAWIRRWPCRFWTQTTMETQLWKFRFNRRLQRVSSAWSTCSRITQTSASRKWWWNPWLPSSSTTLRMSSTSSTPASISHLRWNWSSSCHGTLRMRRSYLLVTPLTFPWSCYTKSLESVEFRFRKVLLLAAVVARARSGKKTPRRESWSSRASRTLFLKRTKKRRH